MNERTVSIRTELIERIDNVAEATGRSRDSLLNEAVEQYLTHQEWIARQIAEAVADADAGTAKVISHEEVIEPILKRKKARPK